METNQASNERTNCKVVGRVRGVGKKKRQLTHGGKRCVTDRFGCWCKGDCVGVSMGQVAWGLKVGGKDGGILGALERSHSGQLENGSRI